MKKLFALLVLGVFVSTAFAATSTKKVTKHLTKICKYIGTKKEGMYYSNGKLIKLYKCAPKKIIAPKTQTGALLPSTMPKLSGTVVPPATTCTADDYGYGSCPLK